MHVFSKQVSDKRDLHCKLLYWMYSTENRQMPLTLKTFLYKFIKTNWRAFTKQANCSGSLRSSKLSFMFPSCCIWRNKRQIRKCHLLLHRVGFRARKPALKQRKVRYETGNGIENVTVNWLCFLSIQTLSRLFHLSKVETHFSILLHRRWSSQGNLHLGKFTSLWLRKAKETHKRVSVFKVPSLPL